MTSLPGYLLKRFVPPALLAAAACTAHAQQAPAPSPSSTQLPADEIVELSPFTVTAADDRGYQAQNTLSGSRLKTELRDIANPVTAFTEQFFLDTGITDTNDLAAYMVNTEYSFNESAGSTGTNQNVLNGNARPLRMRGLGGGVITTNFFNTGGVADTYSTERIEQARGPNAILFGIGNPGGVVNSTTKRARLDRNLTTVSAGVRSYNGTRLDFDHNMVLIPKKAAIRVAAVKSNYGGWRNFDHRDVDGFFGTVKVKVTPTTELNVEGETSMASKHTSRTFTAIDAYTPWRDAGKQITTTDTPNTAVGITRLSANPWIVYDTASGTISSWRNKNTTVIKTVPGGADNPVLTDFSVLPKEATFYGPGYDQNIDNSRLSAYLTQTVGRNFNLELAAMRFTEHRNLIDPQQNVSWYIRADPNAFLPLKPGQTTPDPNPNVGKAYFEAQPQKDTADERTDFLRATANYRFDFGRWIGTHLIGGMVERDYYRSDRWSLREYVISANAPTPLANSVSAASNINNRVWQRTYIDLGGPSDRMVLADPLSFSTSGLQERTTGNTYTTAYIPHDANTRIIKWDAKTMTAMLQSSFLANRLKTVFGMSKDRRDTYQSTQIVVPNVGGNGGFFKAIPNTTPQEDESTNYSYSGVLRVTNWLNLTYSQAHNNSIAPQSGLLHTPSGRPPAAEGKSEDVGVKLTLLENRIYLSALYFQTSADNDFQTGGLVANGTVNAVWAALNTYGVRDASGNLVASNTEQSNGQTFSSRSQGYEVELMTNVLPNWRVFMNYSQTVTAQTNIAPEMISYLDGIRPFWTQGDRGRILLDGSGLAPTARTNNGVIDTVQEQVDLIDQQVLENKTLAEGRMPVGQMKHKFNIRSNYDFLTGPLKGISVGGAVRYLSKPVIGFESSVSTSGISRKVTYGSDQIFFDTNISYGRRTRLYGRNIGWTLQLNVNNVLNNDAYMVSRVNSAGSVTAYRFNAPREWILTYRVTF